MRGRRVRERSSAAVSWRGSAAHSRTGRSVWGRKTIVTVAVLALFALLAGQVAPVLAAGTFDPRTDYTIGGNPSGIAAGDVNGDGRQELIVSQEASDSVTLLTNNGSGGFTVAGAFAAGISPVFVATADINGDGRAEVAVPNEAGNTVSILSYAGSRLSVVSDVPVNRPTTLGFANVTGDANLDLVVTNQSENTVAVFTGNGAGGFTAAGEYAVGGGRPRTLAFGDFNGDGRQDIATADYDNSDVAVLMNSASGFPSLATTYAVGANPWTVRAGDVNGDGRPDLVAANQWSASASVLINNGSGGFTAGTDVPLGARPEGLALTDVNLDGRLDIVAGSYVDAAVFVCMGDGAGGFAAGAQYPVGPSPYGVTTADLNGDGTPDIITANQPETISVLLQPVEGPPDTTAPTTTWNAPTTWQNSDVVFTLSANDNPGGRGVAETYYRVSPATAYSTYTGGVTVAAEGVTNVDYCSVDRAGNREATRAATIRIDKTPPSVSDDAQDSYDYSPATIRLTAQDALSGPGTFRWVLDGTTGTGPTVSARGVGDHRLEYSATDQAGNRSATGTAEFTVTSPTPPPPPPPGEGVEYRPVEGADRIGTAIAASKESYKAGSANTVVVCTAYAFPDALGASALAGAYDGPLLLTAVGSLPDAVADEIVRLGAKQVIVVGGTAAVSGDVEADLKGVKGVESVERVGGADRYETAAKVAATTVEVLEKNGRPYGGTCFVATGADFPDALAASPLAANLGWPILLTKPDSLPDSAKAEMEAKNASKAIVLGGPGAVSAGVQKELAGMLGDANVTRQQGDTRYQTAIAVAELGVANGLTWDGLALATGENFPDALAGGRMQGKLGSVVLLTPSKWLQADVGRLLSKNSGSVNTLRYLGGTGALSQKVRDDVKAALGK